MPAERSYVGLGSNVGDRLSSLESALRSLAACDGVAVVAVSSAYESSPVGPVSQPDFLNAAAELHTGLPPRALLDLLLSVERAHGRVRGVRWGPRRLDLDLLLWGGAHLDQPGLRLPHPGLTSRRFVLEPLLEIAGHDLLHPVTGRPLAEYLGELDSTERVRRVRPLALPASGPGA